MKEKIEKALVILLFLLFAAAAIWTYGCGKGENPAGPSPNYEEMIVGTWMPTKVLEPYRGIVNDNGYREIYNADHSFVLLTPADGKKTPGTWMINQNTLTVSVFQFNREIVSLSSSTMVLKKLGGKQAGYVDEFQKV